jgi:trans-2,3-dihydro-3-hydroxyanthranilate isomerase
MSRALPFVTADVFTDRPFGGNPLAVFLDARGLDDALMQAIAREMNLSETVFVLPPQDARHTRRLRIFTPATELPFAGHPTVGTAVVLAETGALGGAAERMVLEEEVGPVEVTIDRGADDRGAGRATAAVLTSPRLSAAGPALPEPSTLARVLGLPVSAVAEAGVPPGGYEAGVPFAIVPVRDPAALSAIRLDLAAWRDVLADAWAPHLYAVTMEDWATGREIRARMFAPAMGIAEDPATGAAAAALAGFLADRQRLADGEVRWTIRQGEKMGRPSEIALEADISGGRLARVRIGGKAVIMSRGEFVLREQAG